MAQDQTQILQIFQCALEGTQNQILQADQWISDNLVTKNFLVKLLMIADQKENKVVQRQFALTQISRAIKENWNPKNQKSVDNDDKNSLKGSILEAILRCENNQLLKQYKDILSNLIDKEGADWNNFQDEVFNRLKNAQTMEAVSGCLLTVEQLYARNQVFITDINHSTMYNLQAKGFPIISQYAGQILGSYNEQTAPIVSTILKIYQHSIFMELSDITANPNQIQSWLAFVKVIYDFKLPENLTSLPVDPQTAEIRSKHPMFRNKKLCGKILFLYVSKHANKSNTKKFQNQNIAQLFEDKYSLPFLESFTQTIFNHDKLFTTSQDMYFSFKYIQHSLKFKKTYTQIYSHCQKLLFNICIPFLQYTQEDYNVFMNDPVEFIRKEEDQNAYQLKNRNSVMEFIDKLLTCGGTELVPALFKYIYESIDKKQCQMTGQVITDPMLDGLLFCLGSIRLHILKHDQLKIQLEPVLGNMIVKEFINKNPLIRARTCWIFGKYSDIEFTDRTNVSNAVQGVSLCIQENNYLPIQVSAAIALNCLLSQTDAQELLKPNLNQILNIYVQMMNNAESEELIDALDGIIEVFQQDIDPYAQTLVQNLIQSFLSFTANSNNQKDSKKKNILPDDEDDEVTVTGASHCLKAITKILDAPLHENTVQSLNPMLISLLDQIFISDDLNLMDDASNILNLVLYKSNNGINDALWFYYSVLIYNITGCPCKEKIQGLNLSQGQKQILQNIDQGLGCEYIEFFLTPIKNYLSKGQSQFLERQDIFGYKCIDLFMSMIDKVYNEGSEIEKTQVSTLYIALLENFQGQIDSYVENIMQSCLSRISDAKNLNHKNLIILNLEIVSIVLWYNTQFALSYLEKMNYSLPFFQELVSNSQNFANDYEKQRVLLGLASLLQQNLNIPLSLQPGIQYILQWTVRLTSEILLLREKQNECLSDDEDDIEEDNDPIYKKTSQMIQKYSNQQNNMEDSESSYSPERDIDSNSFAYKYDSVLDKLDEILFLENVFKNLHQNANNFYNGLMGMLSQQETEILQGNIQKANLQWQQQSQ